MTTLPPLVGLIGKKRVGKDTFAAVLVEEFGFARVAFAAPLKEMALTIDPQIAVFDDWDYLSALVNESGWEDAKDSYSQVRRFLQNLGDGVRQFDSEFWVRAGMAEAQMLRTDLTGRDESQVVLAAKPVVITDVRYPNEADAIRAAGGILVRIVRPGVDDGDTHASETALDGYTVASTIYNTESVDVLRAAAQGFAAVRLA